MYEICIEGKPFGKQRPRFNSQTHRTYTPSSTRLNEQIIAKLWRNKYGREKVQGYITLAVYAYFRPNKSDSKKTTADKLANKLRPSKKPDADNILKLVADALNGVAYTDDASITTMYCTKRYAKDEYIKVVIDTEV